MGPLKQPVVRAVPALRGDARYGRYEGGRSLDGARFRFKGNCRPVAKQKTPVAIAIFTPHGGNSSKAPTAPSNTAETAGAANTTPGANTTPEVTPKVKTYSAGQYKVGTDIPAGDYFVTADDSSGAYAEVAKDSTGTLDSIVTNDNVSTFCFVTVAEGQYLTVTDGTFVAAADASVPAAKDGVYGAGMYRVGKDIKAGEYQVIPESGATAYVEVSKDCTGNLTSIVSNDNISAAKYVTVSDGQYLNVTDATFKAAS